MNEAINAVFDLNEGAKVSQVSHSAVDTAANLISIVKSLPRVPLHLPHAEANPAALGVNPQHLDVNNISGADDLARMLHALGPTHLGYVNQTFDAGFEFNERAIVGNAGHPAVESRVWRKAFFNALPRIREQLLIPQGHAFTGAIKSQHLNLYSVAHFEKLARSLHASPRHVSYMKETIHAAQINERTVVGKILDLALNDYVFFDLIESLTLLAGIAFFQQRLSRQYNVRPLSIEFDYSRLNFASPQRIQIPDWPHIDLRPRQERANAIDVDADAALDSLHNSTFDGRTFLIGLFQVVPGAESNGVCPRQEREAFTGLHVFNQHVDFIAALDG